MDIYSTKKEISAVIATLKEQKHSIGLVPTMGALHEGHLALVKNALENNDWVVVSIFVNPTQFDNSEDLKKYPRTIERDVELLGTISKDRIIVYTPIAEDIYEGKMEAQKFDFDGLELEMEGKFRDGHFDGVGTIVKRFFDIVKPHNAYFGEKDFQQLQIIRKLVEKHEIPVTIVGCPIYREPSGLAMSSRNMRLKPAYKTVAPFVYEILMTAKMRFGTNRVGDLSGWVSEQFANHDLLELEYFIIADIETLKPITQKSDGKVYRAFIAVYADDIRLIDNIALN